MSSEGSGAQPELTTQGHYRGLSHSVYPLLGREQNSIAGLSQPHFLLQGLSSLLNLQVGGKRPSSGHDTHPTWVEGSAGRMFLWVYRLTRWWPATRFAGRVAGVLRCLSWPQFVTLEGQGHYSISESLSLALCVRVGSIWERALAQEDACLLTPKMSTAVAMNPRNSYRA